MPEPRDDLIPTRDATVQRTTYRLIVEVDLWTADEQHPYREEQDGLEERDSRLPCIVPHVVRLDDRNPRLTGQPGREVVPEQGPISLEASEPTTGQNADEINVQLIGQRVEEIIDSGEEQQGRLVRWIDLKRP